MAIFDTQRTNGGTFLETAPSIARENVGRVALMYKNYGLQMYYYYAEDSEDRHGQRQR